jgi:hypothetical protein
VAKDITKEINTSNTAGSNQNPVTYLQNVLQQPLLLYEFKHVCPKENENVTKSLRSKESHGYDEIPTKVIRQSISCISSPLALIYNLMLSSGTFPARLKFAEIKPLYKHVRGWISLVIDPFNFCHHFPKFLKRSYLED